MLAAQLLLNQAMLALQRLVLVASEDAGKCGAMPELGGGVRQQCQHLAFLESYVRAINFQDGYAVQRVSLKRIQAGEPSAPVQREEGDHVHQELVAELQPRPSVQALGRWQEVGREGAERDEDGKATEVVTQSPEKGIVHLGTFFLADLPYE